MELNYIPFKASGESLPIQISGVFTYGGLLFLSLGLTFFSEKIIGHFVGVILTILFLYFMRRIIRKVEFRMDEITITYFYGNELILQYKELKKFYMSREGAAPFFVYVIKYQKDTSNKRLKKITFWKEGLEESLLKSDFLQLKKNHF